MTAAAAQTRRHQQVEELCAAAIRALTGYADVAFRGHRLHRGDVAHPAYAPHLRPAWGADDVDSFRGAADGLALRLRHSDPGLHRRLAPEEDVARFVFEMLEQFRAEAMADPGLRGLVHNLRHRHESWSRAFHASGLTETTDGLLLYTVAQVCRSRVTGERVVEDTEDLLEATRFALAPAIGDDLAGLRRHRKDQKAYALHAGSIARTVAALVDRGRHEPDVDEATQGLRNGFALLLEGAGESPSIAPTTGEGHHLDAADQGYGVFTRSYDRQEHVSNLTRAAELKELRRRLDDRVEREAVSVPRLARELGALLVEPASDGWDSGQERGIVDGRALAQLVASPTERRLFRTERSAPIADCLVTFLVDCSGSMRQHNETVAMLVDVFGRALDLAGVSSEILGFTTGGWAGGRTLRDWKRAGRPRRPGRLNEVRHLVFKDADTAWRRARPGIAGLLKADIFREGVDGEAVEWASARMRAGRHARRILIVVSDGGPTDSATNLANDPDFLDHHLRTVVAREEHATSAQIYGVGVGLDLSPYYARSIVVDTERTTGRQICREIVAMLAAQGRR